MPQTVQTRLATAALKWGIRGLSSVVRLHPKADPARYGIEITKNVPYRSAIDGAHHLMDVYRPTRATSPKPPVLYFHGGGFRLLSKDTHWGMALSYAARGYPVFVPNYRLAPAAPYPAAVEDAVEALFWTLEHAARYGARPGEIVLAGESAGANLAIALMTARSWAVTEPFARRVFDAAPAIRAVLPGCGFFQVSDPAHRGLSSLLEARVALIARHYLGDRPLTASPPLCDVACFLEGAGPPDRPLPPVFQVLGTRDPVRPDGERLHAALLRHGADSHLRVYPGGHAFHALLWTRAAQDAWRDQAGFLRRVLAPPSPLTPPIGQSSARSAASAAR